MKLEQIEQVISLARTGSFTESARQLYMSQPNLSQSIHQLESEIGNPIFERTPGGVTLTAFGKEYLNHLYTLRNELSSLDDFCLRYAQPDRHVLRIAAVNCDWINSFFSKIIYQYQEHPLQFSLFHTEDIHVALDFLETASIDLAVVSFLSSLHRSEIKKYRRMGLEYHPICTSPLHIMIGKKNPLYHTEDPISIEDIRRYPYVAYGSFQRNCNIEVMRTIGLSPFRSNVILVNTNSALYNIVENTSAFSISANTLKRPPRPSIRAIPIKEISSGLEFGWVKPERDTLSEPASLFIQVMTQSIKEIRNT
ncbi:MAG: LysR family transcriptional regulator [Clostridiales bacterium]|nr:LysR family transcriptional regulator [Clostridiales bacterium]